MVFAAPLWLFALLPWGAVVLYLLWGRRRRVDVPFLELWPAPGDDAIRVRRRATPPPIALALAIVATLLAILAAGRPGVRGFWAGRQLDVILDRGYTMSGRGEEGTRLWTLLRDAQTSIQRVSPYGEKFSREGVPISADIHQDLPTALDTREPLNAAVRKALSRDEVRTVIVLTDQPIGVRDDRIVQVSPEKPVRNVRIVMMSARETPAAQVMTRMGANATLGVAKLRVSSGDSVVERDVPLPIEGERDEFIDFPRLGQTIKAELLIDDDHRADNTAWLVREASWPRVEARMPLPPHVQRMVEVYARQRPASESSSTLVIAPSIGELPAGQGGVVIPPIMVESGKGATTPPEVADHPLLRGVTWAEVGSPGVAPFGPLADWTPVVSAGGKVWVAVREKPMKAVWVGFDTSAWSRSTEYVVFWANVLNWAGAGGERFASYPVGTPFEGEWTAVELAGSVVPPEPKLWPGLYRRADGMLRALHAPNTPIPTPTPTNWRDRLDRLADDPAGKLDVGPVLALLAVVCLCGSAALWKSRRQQAQTGVT